MADTLYKILNIRVQQLETTILREENACYHMATNGGSGQALEAACLKISSLKIKKADLEVRLFYIKKFKSHRHWDEPLSMTGLK